MASIKEKALLVSLTVSVWTNSAWDGSVVEGLAKRTGTALDVHSYRKNLVKPEALAPIKARALALKTYWRASTLPWGDGGTRILPSEKWKEFTEKMRELRSDYERTLADFCRDYPKMKAEARQRLKGLFEEDDFPSVNAIRHKFGVALEFLPIPDGKDFRVAITEDEKRVLEDSVKRQVEQHTKQAMAALVEKLQETVKLMAERMKEADPTLRASLVLNIKEVCTEVDSFNLAGDKRIEDFKKQSEALIKGVNLEALKSDKKARKEVATKADELLAKMASYIGSGSAA